MNIIVDVGDMKISNKPGDTIITYSLGSCIGVTIFDPIAHVGGILHFMLPDSSINPEKAVENPFKFADTAIPFFFKASYKLGAKKNRMKVIVTGGSNILDQEGFFNIGKRNFMTLRKIFFKNNVMVNHEDVGGTSYRTVKLMLDTGSVSVSTKNNSYCV